MVDRKRLTHELSSSHRSPTSAFNNDRRVDSRSGRQDIFPSLSNPMHDFSTQYQHQASHSWNDTPQNVSMYTGPPYPQRLPEYTPPRTSCPIQGSSHAPVSSRLATASILSHGDRDSFNYHEMPSSTRNRISDPPSANISYDQYTPPTAAGTSISRSRHCHAATVSSHDSMHQLRSIDPDDTSYSMQRYLDEGSRSSDVNRVLENVDRHFTPHTTLQNRDTLAEDETGWWGTAAYSYPHLERDNR